MMNIFIGVLGESYIKAHDHRDRLFLHQRAQIVLDHVAWKHALKMCCKRRGNGRVRGMLSLDERWEHIWYCRRNREVAKDQGWLGQQEEDDDADVGEVPRIMADVASLRRDLRELKDQLINGGGSSVDASPSLTERHSSKGKLRRESSKPSFC